MLFAEYLQQSTFILAVVALAVELALAVLATVVVSLAFVLPTAVAAVTLLVRVRVLGLIDHSTVGRTLRNSPIPVLA